MIAAIPEPNLADSMALASEAGRRRLAAAVPALSKPSQARARKASRCRIKRLRKLFRPQYPVRVGEVRVFYDLYGTTAQEWRRSWPNRKVQVQRSASMAGEAVTGRHRYRADPGYCGMCIARCGSVAVIDDGRFVALEPDPTHPTGQALCAKGRAAPGTGLPSGPVDPSAQANPAERRSRSRLATDRLGRSAAPTAAAMRGIADRHGPEAFAFSLASPSTTAIANSAGWIRRLMNAFGSPIQHQSRGLRMGTRSPPATPTASAVSGSDRAAAPCRTSPTRLPLLVGIQSEHVPADACDDTVAALKRGLRLIVIDPRHAGLANKADVWLRVRPGSDGALALGLADLMIERNWYDRDFVRQWSNGPLLVRAIPAACLASTTCRRRKRATALRLGRGQGGWSLYDPASGRYERVTPSNLALEGDHLVTTQPAGLLSAGVRSLRRALSGYSAAVIEASAGSLPRCWRKRRGSSGMAVPLRPTPGAARSSTPTPPRRRAPSLSSML